jgi:hypothetical protein
MEAQVTKENLLMKQARKPRMTSFLGFQGRKARKGELFPVRPPVTIKHGPAFVSNNFSCTENLSVKGKTVELLKVVQERGVSTGQT